VLIPESWVSVIKVLFRQQAQYTYVGRRFFSPSSTHLMKPRRKRLAVEPEEYVCYLNYALSGRHNSSVALSSLTVLSPFCVNDI
jgi:hypothetical protein